MNTTAKLATLRPAAVPDRALRPRARPAVAVIIPCFNLKTYLRRAVQSVLAQSFADFELIVVDDASSDGSLDTIRDISDPRLRLATIDHRGCAGARNEGVRLSSAPLISFLDGDDVWEPDRLAEHVRSMDGHPDVDLSFSLTRVIDANGRALFPMHPHGGGRLDLADLFVENHIRTGSSVMLRRSALEAAGPFDESLVASSDVDMWLRLASPARPNVLCIPQVLNRYRRRRVQVTSDRGRVAKALDQVYDRAVSRNQSRLQPLLSRNLVNRRRYYAYLAWEQDEQLAALAELRESWRASPARFMIDRRSWMLLAGIAFSWLPPFRNVRALPGRDQGT